LQVEEFGLFFDGLNDFLYLLNGVFNKVVNFIGPRIVSIVATDIGQLGPLLNKIIAALPNSIPINGTSMHIDFGLAGNFDSVERDVLTLPMYVALQSDVYPFTDTNKAEFKDFVYKGYDIEAGIS